MTEDNKEFMRPRDWKWVVCILIGIIIYILTYKFWGKSDNLTLTDAISIGSGLVSIALAVIAIIYAFIEGGKSSLKEERVSITSATITANLSTMKDLLNKLDGDISKTHNEVSHIKDTLVVHSEKFAEDTISFYTKQPQVHENNESKPKNNLTKSETSEVNHQNTEKKNPTDIGDNVLKYNNYKRGDVYFADLSSVVGSEQGGTRSVLIIQNDISNKFAPTLTVAAITAQIQKAKLPTHVELDAKRHGFARDSVILLEQTRTIDKSRLTDKITHLDDDTMDKVNDALLIQLGLVDF